MKISKLLRSVIHFFIPVTALCLLSSTAFAAEYAQLSSLRSQIPSSIIPHVIFMEHTDGINNLEVKDSGTKVVVKNSGTYFIVVAAQIGSTKENVNRGGVDLWLVENDKPVANSNTRQSVQGEQPTAVLVSQSVMELKAGDTISAAYSVSDASEKVGLIATPSITGEPAIPSVIFTMFKLN